MLVPELIKEIANTNSTQTYYSVLLCSRYNTQEMSMYKEWTSSSTDT